MVGEAGGPSAKDMGVDVSHEGGAVLVDASGASPEGGAFSLDDLPPVDGAPLAEEDAPLVVADETPEAEPIGAAPATPAEPVVGATTEAPKTHQEVAREKRMSKLDDSIRQTARLAESGKLEAMARYHKKGAGEVLGDSLKSFAKKAVIGGAIGGIFAGPIGILAGIGGAAGSELGKLAVKGVRAVVDKVSEMQGRDNKQETLRKELEDLEGDRLCKLADLAIAAAEALNLEDGEKITFEGAEYTKDEMRLKYFEFVTKMADPNSAENQAFAAKEKEYKKGERGWKFLEGLMGVVGGVLAGGAITEALREDLTRRVAEAGVNMKTGGIGELAQYGSDNLRHMQTLGHNVHIHDGQLVFDYQGGAGGAELQEIAGAMQNAPAWLQNGHFFNSELIQQGMHEAGDLTAKFTEAVAQAVQTKIYEVVAGIGVASMVVDIFNKDNQKRTGRVEAISKEKKLQEDLTPRPTGPAAPVAPAATGGEGGGGGPEVERAPLRPGGIYAARADILGPDGEVAMPQDTEVTLINVNEDAGTVSIQLDDGATADYPIGDFEAAFRFVRDGEAAAEDDDEEIAEDAELAPGEITADERAELDAMLENEREFMERAYALRGARGPITRAERENPDDEVAFIGDGAFKTYEDLMQEGEDAGFEMYWEGPLYGHVPEGGTAEFVVSRVVCSRDTEGKLVVDIQHDIVSPPDPEITARGYERKGFFNDDGPNDFDAEAFKIAANAADLTEPVIIRLTDGQVLHVNPGSAGDEGFSIFNPNDPENPPAPIQYSALTEEGLSGALGVDWYVKRSAEPVVEEAPPADDDGEAVPLPGGPDDEVPVITESERQRQELNTLVNSLIAIGPIRAIRQEPRDQVGGSPEADRWIEKYNELSEKAASYGHTVEEEIAGQKDLPLGTEYTFSIDSADIVDGPDGKMTVKLVGHAEIPSTADADASKPEGDPAAEEKERVRQEISDLADVLVAFGFVDMVKKEDGNYTRGSDERGVFAAFKKLKEAAAANDYGFQYSIAGTADLPVGTEYRAVYDGQWITEGPDGKMSVKITGHVELAPAPANPEEEMANDLSGQTVDVEPKFGEVYLSSELTTKYEGKRFFLKPDLPYNKPDVDFSGVVDLSSDTFGITPDLTREGYFYVPVVPKPADGFTEADRGGFFLAVDLTGSNWDKFSTRFANRATSNEVFTLRDRNLVEYTITGQEGDDYIMTSATGETRMTADQIKSNIVDWYAKPGEKPAEVAPVPEGAETPETAAESTIDADVEALSAKFAGKEFSFSNSADYRNLEVDGMTIDDQLAKLIEKYPDFSEKPLWFLPESASGKAVINRVTKFDQDGKKHILIHFDIKELNPDTALEASGYEQRGFLQNAIKGNDLEKYKKAIDSGEQVVVRDYKGDIYLMTGKNATIGDRYWEGRPFDPVTGTTGELVPGIAIPVDWYAKKADAGAPAGEPATDAGTTESPADEPPAEKLPFEQLTGGRIRLNYEDGRHMDIGGPDPIVMPLQLGGKVADYPCTIVQSSFGLPITNDSEITLTYDVDVEGKSIMMKGTYSVADLRTKLAERNPQLLIA